MKGKYPVACLLFLLCNISPAGVHAETAIEGRLRTDATMVVPGIGSCATLIGEPVDSVMEKAGREHVRISQPAASAELFRDVFRVSIPVKIFFDSIYYLERKSCALCVSRGKIMAIIGFSNDATTVDGVSLRSGINNFIFHYGNNDLIGIEKGIHGLFTYPKLGIALIDDSKDDSIDLFVVFAPRDR